MNDTNNENKPCLQQPSNSENQEALWAAATEDHGQEIIQDSGKTLVTSDQRLTTRTAGGGVNQANPESEALALPASTQARRNNCRLAKLAKQAGLVQSKAAAITRKAGKEWMSAEECRSAFNELSAGGLPDKSCTFSAKAMKETVGRGGLDMPWYVKGNTRFYALHFANATD